MADFITGQPFEQPMDAANNAYATTDPGLVQGFKAYANEEATGGLLGRVAEQGKYEGSNPFAQALYAAQKPAAMALESVNSGLGTLFGADDIINDPTRVAPGSIKTPTLTPQEYNKAYAPTGPDGQKVSLGDKPLPEGVVKLLARDKTAQIQRDGVLARFAETHGTPTQLAVSMAAFAADPINLATMFIPGPGEEMIAARLGTGPLMTHLLSGAAIGAISQAPLSAIKYGLAPLDAADYGLKDAFRDVFYSAAGNAAFTAGLHALGSVFGREAPAARPEGGAGPEGRPPPSGPSAPETHAAMQSAVSQIVEGRPVDVSAVVPGDAARLEPGVNDALREGLNVPEAEHPEAPHLGEAASEPKPLSDFAASQQALYKDGFATGIPPHDLAALNEEIYGPKQPEATAGMQPKEPGANGVEPPAEGAAPGTVQTGMEADLAEAERRWQAVSEAAPMTADERAEMRATEQGLEQSKKMEAAYSQASACLIGGLI